MKKFGREGQLLEKLSSSATATRRSAFADAGYSMHCSANVNIWRVTNINNVRRFVDNFSTSSAVSAANSDGVN
jgi:hypothetical protein